MRVDDGRAFLEHTTDVPEVVVGMDGRPGRLRIRWYKLSSYAKTSHWVQALAKRVPAPLAIIGGGSSDRARDPAWALARQPAWRGDRPLMLITTATAEKVEADSAEDTADRSDAFGQIPLVRVYDGRTFRFCFSNEQMVEAVVDFLRFSPDVRPGSVLPAVSAVVGVDRHPWAAAEARWTYRQLHVNGHARQGDMVKAAIPPSGSAVVAAYALNELPEASRVRLESRLMDAARAGTRVLVLEPIARAVTPWWAATAERVQGAGGRADEWRVPVELPPLLRLLDRAAGLDHRELKFRSLYLPARAERTAPE